MELMRENALGAVYGESASVQNFVNEASDYLDLHRAHMARETQILFPMVERLLTPDIDESVVRGFEAIEGAPGDPHGIREQVLQLRERAGLPQPPAA